MQTYNTTLQRGIRMGIGPLSRRAPLPKILSLDSYLIHMCSSMISEVLDSLCTFAGRVIPNIDRSPHALLWPVNGPLLITRQRWYRLARDAVSLVRLLLILPGNREIFPRPDSDTLLRAALRVRRLFGPFSASPHRWGIPVHAGRQPSRPGDRQQTRLGYPRGRAPAGAASAGNSPTAATGRQAALAPPSAVP